MPKLPTAEDLGGLPSVRPTTSVVSTDVGLAARAQAQAFESIGRDVADAGMTLLRHQEAQEAYEAQEAVREYAWQKELELQQAKRDAQPDQVSNFAPGFADSYRQGAKDVLSGLSPRVRAKAGRALYQAEQRLYRDASQFQFGEQKRQGINQINDWRSRTQIHIATPEQHTRLRNDLVEKVRTNPNLTPIEQDELLRKLLDDVDEQDVRQRVERGDDPAIILRDINPPAPDTQLDTELRAKPFKRAAGSPTSRAATPISGRLETGTDDPLQGVATIAKDAGNTKSYGNFGLNSGGSAQEFVRQYGDGLGLRGEPGTAEFDASWREAAAKNPQALTDAENRWYQENVATRIGQRLQNIGIPANVASDPRVQAYFSDRVIQQGAASIDGMRKHAARIKAAFDDSDGDPVKFLKNITEDDGQDAALKSDFPTALRTGRYSRRGHDTRLSGRLKMALAVDATQPAEDFSKPGGLYPNLSPEKRSALTDFVQAKAKAQEKAREEARVAEEIFSGRRPVDPFAKADKEVLDKTFDISGIGDKLTESDPEAAARLSIFVQNTGYVPDGAISRLRGNAVNGTPEQRQFAYETAANILRMKPGALEATDSSKQFRDDATMYAALTQDAGLDANTALSRIAERKTPEWQRRMEAIKLEIAEGKSSVLKDLKPSDLSAEYDGWFTAEPAVGGSARQSPVVFDTYRELVKDHYTRTGDIEVSKAMAKRDLKRTYDVSSVTGSRRLMRHPPEFYYPSIRPKPGAEPDQSYIGEDLKRTVNDWVKEQRSAELESRAGTTQPATPAKDIPLSDIFIEPVAQTNDDVQSGRPPGYVVTWFETREDGERVWNTVPLDAQGRPSMVWRPDVAGAVKRLNASNKDVYQATRTAATAGDAAAKQAAQERKRTELLEPAPGLGAQPDILGSGGGAALPEIEPERAEARR